MNRKLISDPSPSVISDDTSVATTLHDRVRIVCVVMTTSGGLNAASRDARATWARRCDDVMYASSVADSRFPTVAIPEGPDRTWRAMQYAQAHYISDWYFKVEDNTFVVVENLRYLFSKYNATQPLLLGDPWNEVRHKLTEGSVNSGGLSREALTRLMRLKADGKCTDIVECTKEAGVKIVDKRDAQGRTRFSSYMTPNGTLEKVCFLPLHSFTCGSVFP